MPQKEQARLQVLNSLLAEHMTLDQAAILMGISERHTRRILADYRKNGAATLAHGHRGRKPANAIPEATRSRVVHLARTVYEGATTPIYQNCSVNARASTWAGRLYDASWSTPGSAVRGEGARPSTGCAGSGCHGRAC